MILGPQLIKKCPSCTNLIKEDSMVSGNTFGATFWTDGKREALMMLDKDLLIICPHCQAYLWSDNLEVVAEIDLFTKESDDFDYAKHGITPSIKQYANFINSEKIDLVKLRYLRLQIWWAGNDIRRENPELRQMSPLEVDNLQALIVLLAEHGADQSSIVMKAEVLRELGQFDEASLALDQVTDTRLMVVVNQIRQMVEQGDAVVRKLVFD